MTYCHSYRQLPMQLTGGHVCCFLCVVSFYTVSVKMMMSVKNLTTYLTQQETIKFHILSYYFSRGLLSKTELICFIRTVWVLDLIDSAGDIIIQ